MSNEITKSVGDIGKVMERVLLAGDLSRLSPQDRSAYFMTVCTSLGLNPATKPFDYVRLNGKEVLYATKGATDQLRRVYGISISVVSQSVDDGIMTVHVRATSADGRSDEDFGSLFIAGKKGEDLANAKMKCITKAKRRVTLSMCGLGMLDETEVDSIPNAQRVHYEAPAAPVLQLSVAPPADEPRASLPAEVQELIDAGDFEGAYDRARAIYKTLAPTEQEAVKVFFKPEAKGAA